MSNALQVPGPKGVIIHACEVGFYSECTIKGFYADRLRNQVGSGMLRWFNNTIEKKNCIL